MERSQASQVNLRELACLTTGDHLPRYIYDAEGRKYLQYEEYRNVYGEQVTFTNCRRCGALFLYPYKDVCQIAVR